MYNQTEAILSQYELEIHQTTKGRGAYLVDTSKGPKALVAFRGSKEKGEFLRTYLASLYEAGFCVEQIVSNKEGEAITEDSVTGERFLLKDNIKGTELNTGHLGELVAAVEVLADYHRIARDLDLQIPDVLLDAKASQVEVRRRHYKELVKVKNYIRGRKKKNDFDQMFLKNYEPMLSTAEHSLSVLEGQIEESVCGICHGDYNQHNILKTENGWRIVNFESFFYGWTILDLANFLRKMLEKNNWNIEIGRLLLEAYDRKCSLKEAEYKQLYGLLLFPEKFWKVSNHYMNSRKSWISERDIEKLKKVIEQEEGRKNFMQNMFPFSDEWSILDL